MADKIDESVGPLHLKPTITSPNLSSTVSPGFTIHAWGVVTTGYISKWNLDIFVGNKKYRFSPKSFNANALSFMSFQVPADLIPQGSFWYQIEYKYLWFYSPWAQSGNMMMAGPVGAPTISLPQGVVRTLRPDVSGRGEPHAQITLYEMDSGAVAYGSAAVGGDGTWATTLRVDLPSLRSFPLIAGQTLRGEELWSNVQTVSVLLQPVIQGISVVGSKPRVNGTQAFPYAKVEIFNAGGSGGILMSGNAQSDGSWTVAATQPWAAGDYELTARQIMPLTGEDSVWAKSKSFTIARPNPPTIDRPIAPTSARPMFSGSGVDGATVTVVTHNEPASVLATGVVRSGRWSAALSFGEPSLPAGLYYVTANQDLGGGPSGWATLFTLRVKPNAPVISTPDHPAGIRQVLTVNNVDPRATALKLIKRGAVVAGTFTGSGTSRTFTPQGDWESGYNTVTAIQTVDTVDSDASAPVTFSFYPKPPPPRITFPLDGTAHLRSIKVTGTCSAGAIVAVQDSQGSLLDNATVTSTTWTFEYQWKPGRKDVQAVQIISGVTSDASALLTFYVRPQKLVITPQPNPVDARQTLKITNIDVDVVFDIKDMKVLNGEAPVPGVFTGFGSVRTFTPSQDWSEGSNTVTAVYTVNGVESAPSDPVTFTTFLSPPQITGPTDQTHKRPTTTGTGIEGATVTVVERDRETTILGTATVREGEWTAPFNLSIPDLKAGLVELTATQSLDGVTSQWLQPAFVIKVTPSRPLIDEPPNPAEQNQALDIRYVVPNSPLLRIHEDAVGEICGQYTGTGDTRVFTPSPPWKPGIRKIFVVQSIDQVWSSPSPWYIFGVKPPQLEITPPTVPVAPDQTLTITNVSLDATTLALFDADDVQVHGEFSDIGSARIFTPASDWAPGAHTVKAKQTVDTVDSDFSAECRFTVVQQGEKPEAPLVELPPAGMSTSTHPVIRVNGLPGALITVRLREANELCSTEADANGVLEFKVESALAPGEAGLQVKQATLGMESDWSESHKFVVKMPPNTPAIRLPRGNSSPLLKITGDGETRGHITIRHESDPEDQVFATIPGVRTWSWQSSQRWPLGSYAIVARQSDDGDSSPWTGQAHRFEVIDTLYDIGDAGRVLGQPVVEEQQSVLLRVQIKTGSTGEPASGVHVDWRLVEGEGVMANTETDRDGWAEYRFHPGTAGSHEVLADITDDNNGVAMSWLFEVTALQHDDWAQEAGLYLNGVLVDLATGDIALLRGKTYSLELRVNQESRLIGSWVMLQDLWEGEQAGLQFSPAIGLPQLVEEGKPVVWSVSCNEADGVHFGLNLTSPLLPDWHLPGKVHALDLMFDTFAKVFGAEPAYPCIGATHTLLVKPGVNSLFLGRHVTLELSGEAPGLGVTVTPGDFQQMVEKGVSWTLDCRNSVAPGEFAVHLKCEELDFVSQGLPMILGHNKVQVAERYGPVETGAPVFDDWDSRIRTSSSFTQQVAEGVPVTVVIDEEISHRLTSSDGWLRVIYRKGKNAGFTIHNRYDDTIVEGPL